MQCASSMAKRAMGSREPLDKLLAHQTLRGDIKEVQLLAVKHGQHLPGLAALQGGVVEVGLHAAFLQRIDLVLHQGNQGGDHNADTGPVQGRDLVAERFAAAGGHQDKSVLSADEPIDDLLLKGRKVL